MHFKTIAAGFMAGLGAAQSTTTQPSPSTHCDTVTKTAYGIVTSGIESFGWVSSLNSKYYTEGHTWSGSQVPVWTSEYTWNGTRVQTERAYFETGILEAEGYDIVSSIVTLTECAASPTGTGASEECTPHGDHWHCPPGVEKPSYPPDEDEHEHEHGMDEPSGTACEAHGDHWHCPPGVPEPTSDPEEPSASQVGENQVNQKEKEEEEEEGLGVAVTGHGMLAMAIALVAAHALLL